MRILSSLFVAAMLLAHAGNAHAERGYVDIEKRLTAEQLQATGLNLLSAEQLRLLNSLLNDEQQDIVKAAKADSEKTVLGTWFSDGGKEPISSTLSGDFRGWSTGTIFNLENGQRWRVIEGKYYLGKPLQGLKVLVVPGKISGWYMQVEGQNPRAKVQRVD